MAWSTHALLQFGGDLGAGEIWSCGVRLRPVGGGDFPNSERLDELVQEVASTLADRLTSPSASDHSFFPTTAAFRFAKLNVITESGHYRDPVTHVSEQAPVAGRTAPTVPSFTTFCLTHRTAVKRGRAHAGRIYLPNYAIPMAELDPPHAADDVRLQHATWWAHTLALVCQTFPGGTISGTQVWTPIVASKLDGSTHDITRVEVGSILDFISRRKDAFTEQYVGLPFSVAGS